MRRTLWIGSALALLGSAALAGEFVPSAERGKALLTGRSFIGPSWTESAFKDAGKSWGPDAPDPDKAPDAYASAFMGKIGLHPAPYPNDGLPMGLRKATSRDGKKTGIQVDCMMCHGGSLGGTSYVGLGNTQLDCEAVYRELNRADGRLPPLSPFTLNTARGTVNAGQMSAFLLGFRNTDLTFRKVPFLHGTNLPEIDTPAWWLLGKKQTQYYDGRTDARDARANMQFMLGEKSLDEFQALENDFRDIQAYLKSLKPPAYPFAIDRDRAERGRQVFVKTCTRCHGTYGPDGVYPNEIVALDVIGTDPARAKGISDRLVAHYNATWFAGEYKVDETLTGYQAPPLDGIWATAPYLHNGSVPTLFALIKSSERPAKFLRPPSTAFDHYDTAKVGWKAESAPEGDPKVSGIDPRRIFDSARWGLSNKGHTFGDKLSDEERWAVIEYLKTL